MNDFIDCACLIYGDKYHSVYVEKLYRALKRSFSVPIRFHVFTEESRVVPDQLIKHSLIDWSHVGSFSPWWYKLQLFNKNNFSGRVIYFDLDVVVTGSLDWVFALPLNYFWSIQDFRRLWRPSSTMMNSSVMLWDNSRYHSINDRLTDGELRRIMGLFRGDQEYLSSFLRPPDLKFFNHAQVKSWRWEVMNGGYDFEHRRHKSSEQGSTIDDDVSLLIFHGDPKPHEVNDEIVIKNWW